MIAASGGSIEAGDGWWYHRVPRAGYVRESIVGEASQ
jgi:hypothetical protein